MHVDVVVAGDVTNPLSGPTGAAAVLAPRKSAPADDVAV
jgi:glycerate kinase